MIVMAAAGGDELLKERQPTMFGGGKQRFGMTLYPDNEWFAGVFYGFGNSIFCIGTGNQVRAKFFDCLVVLGISANRVCFEDCFKKRARVYQYVMGQNSIILHFFRITMVEAVWPLQRDVLVQRTPSCNIEHLHAPTDAKHGFVGVFYLCEQF